MGATIGIVFQIERADSPAVGALVAALDQELKARYPKTYAANGIDVADFG